ncbi:calsyntenin-1 [Achroia grisella]|uniref:calsyntenin-1 n=1 Tax=Achroia grisella TaxID=688607 RepID=UPI0027D29B52|nr:calsyntenin-1 [Achroia grisella]
MIVRFLSVLCVGFLVSSVYSAEGNNDNEDIPYLELEEPEEGYHGLIRENETLVEVTPTIRARGPLCSFLILNNKHHGEAPFEIMVIDENEARLRVRYPLNCEKRRNYKFDIAAVGCDGSYSNTVPVHITVTDVNEFVPVFSQAAYVKAVDEDHLYDEILRVEATDKDCTPRYGDVCKYEILTDRSQPFTIDNEGVIRNTEPLDYEKSHNHILSVVAYDCGMMQSAPVMVTIKVNKPCRPGWKGLAERVDYAPGSGPLALFPAARLEACTSDARCPGVTRIQAAVTLRAARAATGCDRDTYALHHQRTLCGTYECRDGGVTSDARCPGVTRIQAAVTLRAARAATGCDRDTYALHHQRTLCGTYECRDGGVTSDARCPGVTRIQAAVTLRAARAATGCDRDTYALHHQRTLCGTYECRDGGVTSDARCPGVTRIQAAVTLRAARAATGCDRDTYALHHQRTLCGTYECRDGGVTSDARCPGVTRIQAAVTLRAARAATGCDRDTYALHHQRTLCGTYECRDGGVTSDARCPGVTRIQAAVTLRAARAATGCDRDTYALHHQRTLCGTYECRDGGVTSDARCPGVTRIQAAVTLRAARAATGCDRDTYALHHQRTLCGLDPKTVDLLPSPGAGNEWIKSLKPDSGRDGEQVFEFDGETTAAVVPETLVPHQLTGTFSISTWMRHAPPPDHDKHRKEHILCLADDHKMNRHHYALFVRNCRLILLLRRDFGDGDLNIFRPAEWRWKIPEVCDDEWHHYAINVRFPSVELVVDGEPFRGDGDAGPEVIDDWPLHPAHGVNTTLVVGACWQGTESDMKHHLHGWLAGLGVAHAPQPAGALRCVARCREGLQLAPALYLRAVSVEGDGVADVETLLRRVAYADARAAPTPGRRNVHVATTVTCDNGRVLRARPADSYVMVLQPQVPSVLLNGTADLARDYATFRGGLRVFPDVSVGAGAGRLDSCVVSVYPALNPDHEALSLPDAAGLPRRYDIRAAVTRDGVILSGADSVTNYQTVLREIEYSNKKPAYYLNRVFKLTCSELNGRFTSNEYVQTLTVVHPHMSGGEPLARELNPSGMADKMDAVARDKQEEHSRGAEGAGGPPRGAAARALSPRVFAAHAQRSQHAADVPQPRVLDLHPDSPPTNHVALVIGVVSCGAVVVLAAVGAARARGRPRAPRAPRTPRAPAPRRLPPADAEMAWDDSALTITVNPMDESASGEGGVSRPDATVCAPDSSDADSCSDSDSDHHDSSDDEDDVMPGKQHKYRNISQLEWDNSTM